MIKIEKSEFIKSFHLLNWDPFLIDEIPDYVFGNIQFEQVMIDLQRFSMFTNVTKFSSKALLNLDNSFNDATHNIGVFTNGVIVFDDVLEAVCDKLEWLQYFQWATNFKTRLNEKIFKICNKTEILFLWIDSGNTVYLEKNFLNKDIAFVRVKSEHIFIENFAFELKEKFLREFFEFWFLSSTAFIEEFAFVNISASKIYLDPMNKYMVLANRVPFSNFLNDQRSNRMKLTFYQNVTVTCDCDKYWLYNSTAQLQIDEEPNCTMQCSDKSYFWDKRNPNFKDCK